jgi:hypothetical protein
LVDRSAFLKLLAKDFYPVLRAQGFKGSGTSLRRADGLFHHIVHIQGSLSARGCYVNLGAHLEFLPNEGGFNVFSPKDFDEPSCGQRPAGCGSGLKSSSDHSPDPKGPEGLEDEGYRRHRRANTGHAETRQTPTSASPSCVQ